MYTINVGYSPCSILRSYWSIMIRGTVFKLLYIYISKDTLYFHCPDEERFTRYYFLAFIGNSLVWVRFRKRGKRQMPRIQDEICYFIRFSKYCFSIYILNTKRAD